MTMGRISLLMALIGLSWNVTVFSAVEEPQASTEVNKDPIVSEVERLRIRLLQKSLFWICRLRVPTCISWMQTMDPTKGLR